MKERPTQSHTPDQGNRYRFVSLRSPCKGTHHPLDTLRSPIMETDQVLACWTLAKRRCPPPFRQTLSLRGLWQAEPTWSFIADHEHSLLARLVARATPKIHHSLGSMRARADHESASMIRFRKGFLHKLRSHHHFGELLSLARSAYIAQRGRRSPPIMMCSALLQLTALACATVSYLSPD